MNNKNLRKGKAKRVYLKKKSDIRGNLNKKKQFESYQLRLLLTCEMGGETLYNGCKLHSFTHGIAVILGLGKPNIWNKKEIYKSYYFY